MNDEKILTLLHLAEEEAQVILSRKYGRLKEMVSSEGGLEKLIGLRTYQFWMMVEIGAKNACWPWKGSRFHHTPVNLPYGKVTFMEYSTTAHRIAYLLTHGQIDQGMDVLHQCDNPPCCNPDHLFLGDDSINVRDAMAKGRHKCGRVKGAAHGNSKLTEDQVIGIRTLRGYGYGLRALAEIYSTSVGNVSLIALRKNWRHI